MADPPWWTGATIYQIYPRSFLDTTGNGIGDLNGVRARLGYLSDLGIDAIWLSPFYTSPMADYGYDVSNYRDVDPLFGSLHDFDGLLAEAHDRGLRVVVDWVPNHTSSQHPWFLESRSSRDNPKRDWYIWRDGDGPSAPPNNWRAAFGGGAWTWDSQTAQWYLHLFLPEQPDLNWRNPEVATEMANVVRFWLDRGVDGFRADAIHCLGKDPAMPDQSLDLGLPQSSLNNDPSTHGILRTFRQLVDSYPGDRMIVGEVYLFSPEQVATYYGHHDELHLAMNFSPFHAPWTAAAWREQVELVRRYVDPVGWPTWGIGNHDHPRPRTRFGGSEVNARAAAVLLLGLRGTAFLYAGDELGLEDAIIPPARRVDPGGRDGCRAPIPWEDSPTYGWATSEPWLPWPPDPDTHNAAAEAARAGSTMQLYRRLLAARRASPALRTGDFEWLPSSASTLAWQRACPGDRRIVAVNFGETTERLDMTGTVNISSTARDEGTAFSGYLDPYEAVVLSPAR
jgi:alpha-glucosidase